MNVFQCIGCVIVGFMFVQCMIVIIGVVVFVFGIVVLLSWFSCLMYILLFFGMSVFDVNVVVEQL